MPKSVLIVIILCAGCVSDQPKHTSSDRAVYGTTPHPSAASQLLRRDTFMRVGDLRIPSYLYEMGQSARITWAEIDAITTYASQRQRIRKEALYALMKVRTDFNLLYRSPDGCSGIVGLPSEALTVLHIQHTRNHTENIFAGAAYLRMLLDANPTDTRAALIAYNSGATSLTRHPGEEPADSDDCIVCAFCRYMEVYSGIHPWEKEKVKVAVESMRIAAQEQYRPRHSAAAADQPSSQTSMEELNWSELEYIVQHYANAYGVDASLVLAIIQVESGFQPGAVSAKGAKGLMQLMPGTARMLGVADPFDPQQNIAGGTLYLAQISQSFGGDLQLTLAAYNAGPGNVRRYGGIPPFPETRRYIDAVLSARLQYER